MKIKEDILHQKTFRTWNDIKKSVPLSVRELVRTKCGTALASAMDDLTSSVIMVVLSITLQKHPRNYSI